MSKCVIFYDPTILHSGVDFLEDVSPPRKRELRGNGITLVDEYGTEEPERLRKVKFIFSETYRHSNGRCAYVINVDGYTVAVVDDSEREKVHCLFPEHLFKLE